MSKAGLGKGIKGAISDDTKNKVRKATSDAGKSIARAASNIDLSSVRTGVGRQVAKQSKGIVGGISEARTGNLSSKVQRLKDAEVNWRKTTGRNYTSQERKDAINEINVGDKYKDVSPILSKGNFNRNTSKRGYGNTGITQDDADRIAKRKRK